MSAPDPTSITSDDDIQQPPLEPATHSSHTDYSHQYHHHHQPTLSLVARYFTHVLAEKDKSYYDWENTELVSSGDLKNRFVVNKECQLGHGKYSFVYEAIDQTTRTVVAIKMIKPDKTKRTKREHLILSHLQQGPNIVHYLGCFIDSDTREIGLVFERLYSEDWKTMFQKFSLTDVCHYFYELFKAIHYTHSQGIIHRDIKPQNIMYDVQTKKLTLLDWGLAEFYLPHNPLKVRVASRYYKPPEILLEYTLYDYSFDMWSIGVLFAGVIFKTPVFFRGVDDLHQLELYSTVLGGPDLVEYASSLPMNDMSEDVLELLEECGDYTKRPWTEFVNVDNADLAIPVCLDLLDKMLKYVHHDRISAQEAMSHDLFKLFLE